MRILACVALLALICFASRPAAAQTGCEGDCDGDGIVRIDELLRAVNVALGAQPPSACTGLDTSGNGVVEINELIAAVVRALLGCQVTGDAAAEAAALLAQDVIDSVVVLDFGVVGAQGGNGVSASSFAAGLRVDTRGLGQSSSCPAGGSSAQRCVVDGGVSQLTVENKECRRALGNLVVIADGTAVTTVEDAKFCDTRVVRAGVKVTEELTGARQRLLDGDGNELVRVSATTTRSFEPSEIACDGQNGTIMVDGVKQFRCTPSALLPKGFPCPPEGRSLTVLPRNLIIQRVAVGTPQACEVRRRLVGDMATIDEVSGERFDAVYRRLVVSRAEIDNNASSLSLTGVVTVPCLGDVQYSTVKPLLEAADQRCPSTGVLQFDFPDGMRSRALFRASALAIDYDADGSADLEVDTCEDAALARCE